jgi:hypothetical protein
MCMPAITQVLITQREQERPKERGGRKRGGARERARATHCERASREASERERVRAREREYERETAVPSGNVLRNVKRQKKTERKKVVCRREECVEETVVESRCHSTYSLSSTVEESR